MALSRIWSAFIILAVLAASAQLFFSSDHQQIYSKMVTGKAGDTTMTRVYDSAHVPRTVLQQLDGKQEYKQGEVRIRQLDNGSYITYKEQTADGILATCKSAVEICIGLIGIMALFMGFMRIAENAGGIRLLSRIIGPFFSRLFPGIPKGHPAMGHMMLNFSANLLGLDNAATPFGIKAMESLQELNPDKSKATDAQIMFLCLHAAGLTLIPVSIIALRARLSAANPTDIFLPCMIATFVATLAAMTIVALRQKINLFQPVIIGWIGGISALIAALIWYLSRLDREQMEGFSAVLSNGLILLIFLLIVFGALYKKINVFDAFVEGAKGGFETSVKIIPYLVGMLVAISMLRTSGVFDLVTGGLKYIFTALHLNIDIVDALPTALIKPLSGSGARGMMVDTMKVFGADSFAGRLSCVFQGSSDTTFYVIAVYFGAVGVKNTRYAIGSMLLADLVGIVTAILICSYWPW
ncbi:nucleoside recognition domain-containing protein [Taibaiella helva]|uniref:nucleoside recognition domain-containing protein n=1 Tax=Taibaiella helva TaxID=2301235 RepID=UPI000E58CDB2|nr:nucleoside recognition domain-containing protein [Taibaiella helva]